MGLQVMKSEEFVREGVVEEKDYYETVTNQPLVDDMKTASSGKKGKKMAAIMRQTINELETALKVNEIHHL